MIHKKLIRPCLFVTAMSFLMAAFVVVNAQSPNQNPARGGYSLLGDFRVETPPGVDPPALFQLLLYTGPNVVARQPISSGGRFRFNNLTTGEYDIVVEYEGNEVSRTKLRVETNGPRDMRHDISLEMKASATQVTASKPVSASSLYKRSEQNQKLFEQAVDAGKQKKYEQAKTLLEQIVSNDPNDFVAWTELGTTFFNLSKSGDAEEAYQKAILVNTSFYPALLNLGKLQLSKKAFDKAIETLTKAVENNPKSAEANHFLGEAFLQNKKGSKAVGYLNEAIRLDPIGRAEIHLRLAALYNGAGMKDKAVAEYEQFLAKKPDFPDREKIEKYIKENKK